MDVYWSQAEAAAHCWTSRIGERREVQEAAQERDGCCFCCDEEEQCSNAVSLRRAMVAEVGTEGGRSSSKCESVVNPRRESTFLVETSDFQNSTEGRCD